jgi:hypothetical protein
MSRMKQVHTTVVSPRATPVVPAKPILGMALRLFYVGDKSRPSGWRTWLVVYIGRKWITLFSYSSLETWDIHVNAWPTFKRECYAANKASIIRILRGNMSQFTLLGLQFSLSNAKLALKLVKAWGKEPPCI